MSFYRLLIDIPPSDRKEKKNLNRYKKKKVSVSRLLIGITPSDGGVGGAALSSFLRRLLLQVLLEDERVTVSVRADHDDHDHAAHGEPDGLFVFERRPLISLCYLRWTYGLQLRMRDNTQSVLRDCSAFFSSQPTTLCRAMLPNC